VEITGFSILFVNEIIYIKLALRSTMLLSLNQVIQLYASKYDLLEEPIREWLEKE